MQGLIAVGKTNGIFNSSSGLITGCRLSTSGSDARLHVSRGLNNSGFFNGPVKVAETRFASHTIVLRRLVKVKEALGSMVTSHQWSIWKTANSERAQKVKSLILADEFWERVQYVLSFTEPIMSMLRFADTDQPCLGEIYDGIDSMVEKIKSIITQKDNDPNETFFLSVKKIIDDRWDKMNTPLHLLSYALSPKYYSTEILALPGRTAPYRDREVASGCMKAFRRIYSDPEMVNGVRKEFGKFIQGREHSMCAIADMYKEDAHTWWYLHGQDYVLLQPLAIKVLSQVASSSSAERNWSTYSYIHSVKRNRLAAKKAEDLVYVHSNLRLLSHKQVEYKDGAAKNWDIAPECANLDASITELATITVDDEENFLHDVHSASGTPYVGVSNDLQPTNDDDLDLDPFDED